MWGGLRRWLGTAQQSLTAQGGALATVKSNQSAKVVLTSSVKIPRLTFHRRLLQGFRSASERSRPPKRRARWSLSHLALALKPGILVESQEGLPDGKLARVRGPRCSVAACVPRARRAAGARAAHRRPKLPSQAVLCLPMRRAAPRGGSGWRTTRTSARCSEWGAATACAPARRSGKHLDAARHRGRRGRGRIDGAAAACGSRPS